MNPEFAQFVVDLADEPYLTRVTTDDILVPTSCAEIVSDPMVQRGSENYLLLRIPLRFVTVNPKPAQS